DDDGDNLQCSDNGIAIRSPIATADIADRKAPPSGFLQTRSPAFPHGSGDRAMAAYTRRRTEGPFTFREPAYASRPDCSGGSNEHSNFTVSIHGRDSRGRPARRPAKHPDDPA